MANRKIATVIAGNPTLIADSDTAIVGNGVTTATGDITISSATGKIGFNGAPISKPTVTGSRGGNAALASLLTALASYGLIIDGTSA